MAKQIKMRSVTETKYSAGSARQQNQLRSTSEIQSRIDALERQHDAYAGNAALQVQRDAILREIAALRWVLGGDGAIPFRS